MGEETNEDGEQVLKYAWETGQRALFLVLGILLFVTQLLNGSVVLGVLMLVAFSLIFFTYGQTQAMLTPRGVAYRGAFGRKFSEWSEVEGVASGRSLGVKQLRLKLTSGRQPALPAPIDGFLFRDRGYAAKASEIESYVERHATGASEQESGEDAEQDGSQKDSKETSGEG